MPGGANPALNTGGKVTSRVIVDPADLAHFDVASAATVIIDYHNFGAMVLFACTFATELSVEVTDHTR